MAKYQVAIGTLQLPGKGNTRQLTSRVPNNAKLWPGDPIPDGVLGEAEIQTLLDCGVIVPLSAAAVEIADAGGKVRYRGKWSCDPKELSGKSFEDLQLMIFDIDNKFNLGSILDRGDAITQLTLDWDPNFRDTLAMAPTALQLIELPDRTGASMSSGQHSSSGIKDFGSAAMSAQSEARLAELKARANQQPPQEG